MAADYTSQFATAYLATAGNYPFADREAMAYLAPMLRAAGFSSSQYPSIESVAVRIEPDPDFGGGRIVGGPWNGTEVADPLPLYVTGLKWNLRTSTHDRVTTEMLGAVRAEFRKTRRSIAQDGYQVITWSLQPFGSPLAGDHGVPVSPALPPRKAGPVIKPSPEAVNGARVPKKGPPWAKILGGIAAFIAIANAGCL